MAGRKPLLACPQLLHVAARARSATIGHVHWLVAAQNPGRLAGWRLICFAWLHFYPDIEHFVRAVERLDFCPRHFLRHQTRRAGGSGGCVVEIGKKALKNEVMVGIAVLAFIAIFFFKISFPYIVLAAGLIGYFGGKIWEEKFYVIKGHADVKDSETGLVDQYIQAERPSLVKTLGVALFWLAMWLLPVLALVLILGTENVFSKQALFFSQSAMVTFGGAYSVLAYISQKAVETYGWLQPGEMLDGLGMAETTPGPLIQVVQFVGFMGAFRNAGTLDPILAGVLASVLVTWVTYLPSFFFIFTGAPYIEYLRGNKSLSTALSGITAAVVGVILNLGIWFSLHTLFGRVAEHKFGAFFPASTAMGKY